ncbi:hypothetical protein [Salmonella phage SD-15_S21]|nr:hypothetical protein [Salmonella phage SD-15_S21]
MPSSNGFHLLFVLKGLLIYPLLFEWIRLQSFPYGTFQD